MFLGEEVTRPTWSNHRLAIDLFRPFSGRSCERLFGRVLFALILGTDEGLAQRIPKLLLIGSLDILSR